MGGGQNALASPYTTSTLERGSCSGFGRYQAVETMIPETSFLSFGFVAVGLAAIRPLKQGGVSVIRVASGLQWVWPLSGR